MEDLCMDHDPMAGEGQHTHEVSHLAALSSTERAIHTHIKDTHISYLAMLQCKVTRRGYLKLNAYSFL